MIKIESLGKDCCGCNACYDICPKDAINFKTDIEGFWYPQIDKEKCIDCGLCDKTCPVIHTDKVKKNDFDRPKTFAAVHKNLEIRFDSTSGGLFSAFAEKMYKDGGYVGGAIYNDDFSVSHYISNNKKDLVNLRSSKYLQSDATGIYSETKRLLETGEKVLVCGTPCQMAGLRRFLNKEYENLIIVDFVCRGVNSPKVFRKYLDSLENETGGKIVHIKSKTKELGWRKLTTKFIFDNGKTLFNTKDDSLFARGYLQTNVFCRPSCYDCKFKGFPRIADLTIADFWGIENVAKSLDHDLGTSMVLINSEKGKRYFEQIKAKTQSEEVEFETIFPGNPALTESLSAPKVDREKFFEDIDQNTFNEVAEKYFPFPRISKKQQLKKIVSNIRELKYYTKLYPKPLFQFIKYNLLRKETLTNWKNGGFLIPSPKTVFQIEKGAKINCNGMLCLGFKKIEKSKLESRLLIEEEGSLEVENKFVFSYGFDVEIFNNAKLILKGAKHLNLSGCNIGITIICGEKIEIGYDVQIGRNVTIRDNNGGHFISRQGYKNSRPVIIKDRAWLGEGCTIMPGVKIGEGAIIAAHSLVISNVPANSIVAGNPAKVVDRDVLWKY